MTQYTRSDVIGILREFLEGKGDDFGWGDFITSRITDHELEAVRARCCGLSEKFPPTSPEHYCNEAGLTVIQEFIHKLQASSA